MMYRLIGKLLGLVFVLFYVIDHSSETENVSINRTSYEYDPNRYWCKWETDFMADCSVECGGGTITMERTCSCDRSEATNLTPCKVRSRETKEGPCKTQPCTAADFMLKYLFIVSMVGVFILMVPIVVIVIYCRLKHPQRFIRRGFVAQPVYVYNQAPAPGVATSGGYISQGVPVANYQTAYPTGQQYPQNPQSSTAQAPYMMVPQDAPPPNYTSAVQKQ